MKQTAVNRATLGRLPVYLQYLKSTLTQGEHVSATAIARALELGEVQVRKDLNLVSGAGKPKIGYCREELTHDLEDFLGLQRRIPAVIVGVGKLGSALLGYEGFSVYGLGIEAAFDCDAEKTGRTVAGKTVRHTDQLGPYCRAHGIHIGIIAVPESAAQAVCDQMVGAGITAIWNFAPTTLSVPDNVQLQNENLALSLAHLSMSINHPCYKEADIK